MAVDIHRLVAVKLELIRSYYLSYGSYYTVIYL